MEPGDKVNMTVSRASDYVKKKRPVLTSSLYISYHWLFLPSMPSHSLSATASLKYSHLAVCCRDAFAMTSSLMYSHNQMKLSGGRSSSLYLKKALLIMYFCWHSLGGGEVADNACTWNQSLQRDVRGAATTLLCIASQEWHLLAVNVLNLRLIPLSL